MSNRTNKFYIKQFNIDNISFQDFVKETLDIICKDNYIVGYIFVVKETIFLNLYLFKKNKCDAECSISLDTLANDWKLFFYSLEDNSVKIIFRNPPIDMWLDSKDNWCKKIASSISSYYNIPYEEALSDTYLGIMKCYNKDNVYMGNLNYLRRNAFHTTGMRLRENSIRVNQDSGLAISLSQTLSVDTDDNDVCLEDTVASPDDTSEDSIEYNEVLDRAKILLAQTFSPREIEQILTVKNSFLPPNIYQRLRGWRSKHPIEELYK